MILNTVLHGLVAGIYCIFFLCVAWEMAHRSGDKENVVAVLFALLGTVSLLLAIEWVSAGL